MFYRENGQFKTSYQADQQIFPIRQDRWFIAGMLLVGFVGVPCLASDYIFSAILIPFVIMAMAALGVNILAAIAARFRWVRAHSWRSVLMALTTSLPAFQTCH